jgi:hypothetical protein
MRIFQAGRTEGGLKDCGAKLNIFLTIFRCTSNGFIPDYREAIVERNTNRTNFEKDGHMRLARYRFFLLPFFFVLACVGAFAQANSEVTGIVTDQTGAVVAGANVTLSDPDTGFTRTVVSGPTGLYDFAGLNPSNYTLKAAAKGFQAFVQTGIVVNVSGTFRVDVKLTLGAETQTITVEADALAVQTDSNVISTLINSETITSIATMNRNFAALAALGLGVSSKLPDSNSLGSFGADWSLEFNGLREAHNIWLIDGGESADRGGGGGMQIQPSQDAIAEFQMMTSNYPPDYGISSGATISMSLKSGTKNLHASAWEENRATAYNANSWVNKNNKNPRVATHYNVYGFNVGGPVFIPHTYNTNRNKTFFFFNMEWRKTSGVATSFNRTIPTADRPTDANMQTIGGVTGLVYKLPAYAADQKMTGLVVPNVACTGCDPNNPTASSDYYDKKLAPLGLHPGQPFPNNLIPKVLLDANAASYVATALPAVTDPSTDKSAGSAPLPQKVTDTIVRIDHNFNDKWAILGHYIVDHQNQTYGKPELGWCGCDYNTLTSILSSPAHSATIKLTGAINSNLLVEASFNYDGNAADITPSANTFLPSSWTSSVSPVVGAYAVQRSIWPNMSWDSTFGQQEQTATEPYHNAAQDYAPKLDVSYTKGKHQLKFGFSYNRYTKNQILYSDVQGSYTFGLLSGDTLMDTIMGIPTNYTQTQTAALRHYYSNTTSAYAQDNWHVTPRLSLQIGVRYDAMPQTVERQNLLGNFVPSTYQTGNGSAPQWNTDGSISSTSPTLFNYQASTKANPNVRPNLAVPLGTAGSVQSYINGTLLAGQGGTPRGAIKNDYQTIQPRLGFSEDLFGNGKTILRGGFGTFYEHFQGNVAFNIATSAPYNPSLNVSNPYFSTPGTNWSTGNVIAADHLIFAGNGSDATDTFRAPAVAMYSLGVQHQISPSVIWVGQYVGNLQWHQNFLNDSLNGLPTNIGLVNIAKGAEAGSCSNSPVPSSTCVDARRVAGDGGGKYTPRGSTTAEAKTSFDNNGSMNAYRQYPGYGSINRDENSATGNYNGLQTAVRIQNRWGLSGEFDYTYSHQIDIQSQDRNEIDNPWFLKYDKGSGDYDRRHIVNVNYVYNLPFFNKSAGLLKSIAGGWQIAGTVLKQTGTPQLVKINGGGVDPVGLGGGYVNHPNITPGGKLSYPKKSSKWFDTSRIDNAVRPVWDGGTNLGFGSWGRDTLVLPGRFNLTTSVYKTFQLYKEASFQLKFESFNTLNHTEFNAVDTGSGALTGTNDPRNLQLAGKFNF